MSAEPGTVRAGGRTARVRTALLRAAGDVLVEQGFDHLDLAEVARRAEVGRTTVYRRRGTVTALIADLLADMAEQSLPRTGTRTRTGTGTGSAGDARTAEALRRARRAPRRHGPGDRRTGGLGPPLLRPAHHRDRPRPRRGVRTRDGG